MITKHGKLTITPSGMLEMEDFHLTGVDFPTAQHEIIAWARECLDAAEKRQLEFLRSFEVGDRMRTPR